MGIVSPEIHRNHHIPGTAMQIVISGLFDSIGLYRHVTAAQQKKAGQWLDWIGLSGQASQPFRRLLILDEPTQGLDDANREGLLRFLEIICDRRISTILYVSHRKDEHRPFFRQHIRLETYGA